MLQANPNKNLPKKATETQVPTIIIKSIQTLSAMPLFKRSIAVTSSGKQSTSPKVGSSKSKSSEKKSKSPKDPNEKLPPILSCTWGPIVPKSAKGHV